MIGRPAPGQFAVTATGGWEARVIQWVTRSTVNHAILCVAVGANGEAYCVEAQPRGARPVMASSYPHAIWSDHPLSDEQRKRIVAFGHAVVGTPYGWLDCAAAGLDSLRTHWRLPVPHSRWALQRLASLRTMDCSQLVAEAYALAGITLCRGVLPCEVSPGDLLRVVVQQQKAAA